MIPEAVVKKPSRRAPPWLAPLGVAAAAAALRLVALRSDAYGKLDWSMGLLTDEAFYAHNARNLVAIGVARTDDFNNMLIMPLLHALQVGVFRLFGVSMVSSRMISVVCSLLTLWLVWAAARRAFGVRPALFALAFLGLDHANALFNRMALMDTPAALPAAAALFAFVAALQSRTEPGRIRWLAVCGAALGLACAVRGLCAYLLPAPILALAAVRGRRSDYAAVAMGAGAVLAAYGALWYLPHRAEIAAMNRYYWAHQLRPQSAAHLWQNLQHALLGDFRGVAPYLFRHTPVLFGLCLAGLAARALGRLQPADDGERGAHVFCAAWLIMGWAMLAVVSYSPSRYYVTTYPAMAVIAAAALSRLDEAIAALTGRSRAAAVSRACLVWLAAYHAVESLIDHGGVAPRAATMALLYGLPSVAAIAAAALRPCSAARWSGRSMAAAVTAVWALVNAGWLVDWARSIEYTQAEGSAMLGRMLPAGAVLLGDVGVGLSMENALAAVNVRPGLCNGVRPIERWAGRPRYIVILDGRRMEAFWRAEYPQWVSPDRRIRFGRALRWFYGVFQVDTPAPGG